jgi:eukaryotic-like serine/threonine-protein kinase
VPKVSGLPLAEATATLADADLRWEIREIFSDRVEEGVVASQDPKPGEAVDKNTVITLRVSRGIETAVVPDVLQQSQSSAEAELAEAGFEVSAVSVESDAEPGLVVSQDPAPGVDAPRGSTVTIGVSTGPSLASVPNVVGFLEGDAIAALESQGFSVSVTEDTTLDPGNDGVVAAQDPGGGSEAQPGSTITIVVLRFIVDLGDEPGLGNGRDLGRSAAG